MMDTIVDVTRTREPMKLVVAHFMVGNTYPYTPSDWVDDIKLASTHGLDGFALNVGREDWVLDRVSDCFDAAALSLTNFKLFISFDMSSFKSTCAEDVNSLKAYTDRFAQHPNYLKLRGKAVVSTFSGETAFFGKDSLNDAWSLVKRNLSEKSPIHFLPSFFVDPRIYHELHCMDGAFHWNGGWPTHLNPQSPRHEVRCPNLTTDQEHLRYLHRRTYMAAVSPWFFTHYGVDSWNKNWIYRSDDWLFVRRWEYLISIRDQVDVVQVISWNDYGESHYIGPIKGAQPNSETWVNGFEHLPWLHLNSYFAHAFKTGRYPILNEDHVYVWARPHLRNAVACKDSVDRPTNWQLTDDEIWIIIIATEPAAVQIWSDFTSNPTNQNIPGGLSKLKHPLVRGCGIRVRLLRLGEIVLDFRPMNYNCDPFPETYNFNAFVATHPPSSMPQSNLDNLHD